MNIFDRNIRVWGENKQKKIEKASVLIVGIGGLGAAVSEILVRSGVGKIIIVDSGKVDEPDLNRQIIYTKKDVGEFKVNIAASKLKAIGTGCEIIPINRKIEDTNEFFSELNRIKFDIVMDCLDNYKSRFVLEKMSDRGQYMISGGVSGTFGQVITLKFGGDIGMSDIYEGLKEDELIGVTPQIAINIASVMANECIKCITDEPLLLNRFLVIDLEDYNFDFIDLKGD